jgi:hypothetical protein
MCKYHKDRAYGDATRMRHSVKRKIGRLKRVTRRTIIEADR